MRNEEFENIQNFVFCDQKIHFTKFMKRHFIRVFNNTAFLN